MIDKTNPCDVCHGRGYTIYDYKTPCDECGGSGYYEIDAEDEVATLREIIRLSRIWCDSSHLQMTNKRVPLTPEQTIRFTSATARANAMKESQ